MKKGDQLVATLKKKRKNREEYQRKKSLSLARQFEEGVSILSAPLGEDGKRHIQREKFLEVLGRELSETLSEESFSPEELERLQRSFSKRALAPGSAVAMVCRGPTACPWKSSCELAKIKKAPRGKPCPYETVLFAELLAKAVEELDVDPGNSIEMNFCNELATTDLLIMRMDLSLSKPENAELLYEQTIFDKQGNETTNLIISPCLEARDKLVKRRDKIVNLMVGDRKEKYKRQAALKLKDDGALSVRQSIRANQILEAQLREKEAPATDIVTPDDLLGGEEV